MEFWLKCCTNLPFKLIFRMNLIFSIFYLGARFIRGLASNWHSLPLDLDWWDTVTICTCLMMERRGPWRRTLFQNRKFSSALCSRNFQNVKLRLDFVEIWLIYRHSDFTWNQILANYNGPKMLFLAILEVLNFHFCKLSIFQVSNSPKFQS